MRILLGVFTAVLILVAILGFAIGIGLVVIAANAPGPTNALAIATAAGIGLVPFAIGTVALGFVAIVFAVDVSRRDQREGLDQLIAIGEQQLRIVMPEETPAERKAAKEWIPYGPKA